MNYSREMIKSLKVGGYLARIDTEKREKITKVGTNKYILETQRERQLLGEDEIVKILSQWDKVTIKYYA